jgi:hypothetical protein
MREFGLEGVRRGRSRRTTGSRRGGCAAGRSRRAQLLREPTERAVGGGPHLRRDLVGVRLRRLRRRRVQPVHRRMADLSLAPDRPRPGRPGDGDLGPQGRARGARASLRSRLAIPVYPLHRTPRRGRRRHSVGSRGDSYDNAHCPDTVSSAWICSAERPSRWGFITRSRLPDTRTVIAT